MKTKIYFCSLPNGYFGSASNSWDTLSVERLASSFNTDIYDVEFISVTDILHINFNTKDVLIYTSFFNDEVRSYLKDILYFVKDECLVIPSYEILLAHENKGFQEVIRRRANIDNLQSDYVFDLEQIKLSPPFVLKTVGGSGSLGVELIKTDDELQGVKDKYSRVPIKRTMKNFIRSKQLPNENYQLYSYFYKPFKRFVTQSFVEDLSCDYRILIVANRLYAMRRDVRDGDFRASGSKKFRYNSAPTELLDYAEALFQKLNNPFISMDLALKDGKPYLIEFQGTNFGSSVIRKSSGYYVKQQDQWSFIEEAPLLEETLSLGLLNYVIKKTEEVPVS